MQNDEVTSFPAVHLADASQTDAPGELRRRRLKELAVQLSQCYPFRKGQFVQWKPGLKNRNLPDYGEPAIITAVMPGPIFDPSENAEAGPYFHEPLTLIIGTLQDGDLLEFLVDRRRFEPA